VSRYAAENYCSRELLTGKAEEIEKTISVKEREKERYDFDPTMFYENISWNRREKWYSDYQESPNTIHPRVQTVI